MNATRTQDDHGALMDSIYRGQRHIYDVTRKYYLFGRDRLIRELDCRPGQAVLEIGCGTGRNLLQIARHWSGISLYGLDISREMLKSAEMRLGNDAVLALGDATRFDPHKLFGRTTFDRVVISFTLSMIPDWQRAMAQAAQLLATGGSLHIIDFGDMDGIPALPRMALKAWLAQFHVTPRTKLPDKAASLAARKEFRVRARRGLGGYYTLIRLERRESHA